MLPGTPAIRRGSRIAAANSSNGKAACMTT
jgi:hypothetical protein